MPEARIEILVNEPIAEINPNLHGHFMEHLGHCVAGGTWVGETSHIPNVDGVRNDVVEALKAVESPVIRWPGGCFADDYHWKDGIGEKSKRPKRINIHWGDVIEDNHFGTHEFMAFCKATGSEPYFSGNLGAGTPQEMRDWVEYCNFPGESSWAQERKRNGSEAPFNVKFWGVGNENWGCGGNFTPEDYGTEFRRFATYLRNWGKDPLYLIGCGPNGNDLDWTRRFFTKLKKDYWGGPPIHGYSAHYYCGTAGTATEYTTAQWYELLWKANQMEPLVVQQRAQMDAFDPERKVGLIVDEWGTWHPPTPGRNPAFLWQQNTVRDALVAALTLDIFHRHSDKVVMSNIAQTINVLQALLLTEDEKMIKTPTYYIYDLYKPHKGGTAVRALFHSESIDCHANGKAQKLPLLSGSASIKGKTLTLTVVNTSADETIHADVNLSGVASASEVSCSWLAYPEGDLHAHNTFTTPEVVTTASLAENHELKGGALAFKFHPASVTRLTFALG